MMKKTTAWLLALALVFSMLPGMELPVAAAETGTELQAYYTYDTPYIDGAFDELNWAFDGNNYALLSDEHYLYVALNNSDPAPKFVINGVSLTANLAAGIVTNAKGAWAGVCASVITNNNNRKIEVKIPLKSVLGLDYAPGQTVKFTYSWASINNSTLVLASRALVSYEGFDGTLSNGGKSENQVYAVQENSALQLLTGVYSGSGASQSVHHKVLSPQQLAMNKGVTLEFTADFTSLAAPTATDKFTWYDAGVGVELRADPCRNYGFHAENGYVHVTQRSDTEAYFVNTGVAVGTKNVNVRLVSDDSGKTIVYINGTAKGDLPAAHFACPTTGGRGYYQINNSTEHCSATNNKNNVTMYNLILTQDAPAAESKVHPLGSNANADITAYLNPNGFEMDGVLTEAAWYTPYRAAGTGTAPGGMVGISWGNGKLYVGGETAATAVTLTVNGKTVSATLGSTPSAGEMAVSGIGFEWAIPFSAVNLSGGVLGKSVAYTLTLANSSGVKSTLQGTLHFTSEQMLLGDTGRNYSGPAYVLTTGDGHIWKSRTDNGYTLTAEGLNKVELMNVKDENGNVIGKAYQHRATGTFVEKYSMPIDYSTGAIDLTMTMTVNDLPNIVNVYGMRGMIFELCGDTMREVFALRKDIDGTIWMDIRDTLEVRSKNLGVKVGTGKAVTFRFAMDDKQSVNVFVDDSDEPICFPPVDRNDLEATLVQLPVSHFMWGAFNSDRALNADGKSVSVVDVVIHDMRLTKNCYPDSATVLQAMLDQLTEEQVFNGTDFSDVTALNLAGSVSVKGIDETASVTWKAIDKLTNRVTDNVNIKTGAVTRAATTQGIDLKATVTYNGISASKTFTFQTRGTQTVTSDVTLIENDDAPANGVVEVWDGDRYAYLDDTHNSIVVNRGSSTKFNRIVLQDSDDYSRVSARHLGVFISDDGQTWKKVTGWLLHQDGRNYTLYNLNETAQYVKVHCYHDDLDLAEKPSFYNKVSDMIKVSYEGTLPGARSRFAHSTTFTATNDTGKDKKDTPVFVSLAQLGATADQYRTGCPDFRFTVGETTLAHWYNGKDGFYVRVPSIPANGKTTVTAHWGSKMALDYSDGETTFEVTYGNVSLINISRETYETNGGDLEKSILSHGRPFTFPNGEVIVVGRTMKAASNAGVFRSTDGGHTFEFDNMAFLDGDYISKDAFNGATYRSSGFGGYMWDDSITTEKNGVKYEGRLYLITYSGQGGNASDYRLVLQHSDDYAHTWSEPVFLSLPGASDVINKNTKVSAVSTLQNAEARIGALDKKDDGNPNTIKAGEMASRAQIVCDGLVLQGADGSGPNVDYVIHHGEMIYDYTLEYTQDGKVKRVATNPDKNKRNVATAIYSSDGGETWYCSDTLICIPGVLPIRNNEDGLSEGSIAQLDNGNLYVVIRGQEEGNYYQYKAVSEDLGKTWILDDYDNVLSANTSPVLAELGNDRLEMWSACHGLGETSYRRTPMHLGLSTDNYQTFEKILDLTFATAFDSVQAMQGRKSQPGIAIYTNKETNETSAFVCYHDQNWHENPTAWKVDAGKFLEKGGTMGFAIEEFDQMVYGTKGAWDDFEDASLKYQGWLVDTDGTIELSREQAVSGKQSMKVVDDSSGSPAHALRQIPSMKSGTVGAKLMVPKNSEAPFIMELKAGYNYDHMKFAIAAIYVTPNGTVGYVDANKVQHALTTVTPGSWNDYALSFDIGAGTGTLYVNGESVGSFPLPSATPVYDLHGNVKNYAQVQGVTAVQFNQAGATQARGDCLYVDDFYANELVDMTARTVEEPKVDKTLLGRFTTIIRAIIEVDGESVQILDWVWIPGL